jgi:hypothetical protein
MDILTIFTNLLFVSLGFWMGRTATGQAIPKINTGKPKLHVEEDPYEKAMRDPDEERIETT